jgi:dephospho-CoA kinase
MPKLIIGLTGEMAAGKGTIAAYLETNYGAETFGFSAPLRDIVRRLYIEEVRPNLAALSNILRTQFGSDLISRVITEDLKRSKADIVVLDGIRRMPDIELASKLPEFVLISVETDQKIRYERLINRRQNQDDQHKTFEQFLADHQAEADKFIPDVMAKAKYVINNDGDFDKLYEQVDKLISGLSK